ncbi:hypothetical protein [Ureibacillus aquaedulcis]|uniref:Uncharacterized protein n=1 Tax=Ureibacillus aquaedulcis TaxID=3058421 RepID=A0ABT8GN86_9BACL|nr:hypothetical protein [Ureibacillus sp. BA0131]MDN4492885.1 hypothetical protein [Ureibacillus sp. BA0131]
MNFELIDQAYNIANFDNQATELTYVLSRLSNNKGYIKKNNDEDLAILNGYKLALELIQQYPELIRPTLNGTMVTVKRKYQQLTRFSRNYSEVSAVSLAMNHLQTMIKRRKIINQVELT